MTHKEVMPKRREQKQTNLLWYAKNETLSKDKGKQTKNNYTVNKDTSNNQRQKKWNES